MENKKNKNIELKSNRHYKAINLTIEVLKKGFFILTCIIENE